MKIKRSQLTKIILENLLVEAISVEQAEEKFRKEIRKIWGSINFLISRDGIDAINAIIAEAQKYDYSPSPYQQDSSEWIDFFNEEDPDDFLTYIDYFVPVDVNESDRSNSILWLIKQLKKDLGLFFALIEEESAVEDNYGNLGAVKLFNKIRNSLEKFGQFKRLINPPEKRDLFRIENMQELFSIIEAHEAVIDAENERLGSRISADNIMTGFVPLRGGLNIVSGNVIQKNPQTGFYTKPDSEGFVIGEIHNKAASVRLGSGTEWCTAAPGLDYFNDYYSPDDPLYYIEDNGERFQFSYSNNHFMNSDDIPIEKTLIQRYTRMLADLLTQRDGSIQNEKLAEYLASQGLVQEKWIKIAGLLN